MSESTLSVTYDELMNAVKAFLGYQINTDENNDEVDMYVQSGVRQFYFPSAVNGVDPAFEWSFLKPTTTLDVIAGVKDYDLPANLGRIAGNMYFEPNKYVAPVLIVAEAEILAHRQHSLTPGAPRIASVRFKVSDGTSGQRQELSLWPVPDADYTLTYRYEAFSGKLSKSAPYPLGGMKHSELIIESCLAVAEQRADDAKGLHTERFGELLIAAVARDGRTGAHNFGNMGGSHSGFIPHRNLNGQITYKGETW